MSTMELKLMESVHLLTLTNSANYNALTMDVLDEYLSILDQLERYDGNTSLLISCQDEKTFCNGIDLEWASTLDKKTIRIFTEKLELFCRRLALLNMPTVAAINGNCYAGGALIAAACDFRYMREDRGRFCYPEVNIKIPFTAALINIIDLIPNKQALNYLALTGNAMTGLECFERNVVDAIFSKEELHEKALEFSAELSTKDRDSYTKIKHLMRPNVAREPLNN